VREREWLQNVERLLSQPASRDAAYKAWRDGYSVREYAGFKSLSDAWADTTTPHGRLMLTILGGLAEFERELILARTGDGRARAKAKGVRFGRPRKLTPHQRQEALQRLAAGETQADVARTYNVDATTIGRLASPSPFGSGAALQ
jgi:DNA invertase Pin-like site-specific DNA recombinase